MKSMFSWKWRIDRREFFIICWKVIIFFLCFNIIPITYYLVPGLDNNDYKDEYMYYIDKIEEITGKSYYYSPIPAIEQKKLEKYDWYDEYREVKKEYDFKTSFEDLVLIFTLVTFKINILFAILSFYILNVTIVKRMHDIWLSWRYLFVFHFFNLLSFIMIPLMLLNFSLLILFIWILPWDKTSNKYGLKKS